MQSNKKKNFRKRTCPEDDEAGDRETNNPNSSLSDDEEERRLALEEVKFLQKQRERKFGIPALPASQSGSLLSAKKLADKNDAASAAAGGGGEGEKEELVLQDTFAQETAVMVEDPNMLKYVEQELAKKRGKNLDLDGQVENELTRAEDELYIVPDHLKVKRRNSEESSTQWTTGIAEIQLPIEYAIISLGSFPRFV
ncbi:unnamed protein product [Linum tenue]|uniref:Uncharacterized protein n=1 Tax=Linum tenue TaxID=586396 RepID=A0AAV0LVB8_9ROSI|nr:unnamed protein product [Linum tenue]